MNAEDFYKRDKEVFNQLMQQSPIGIGIVNEKGTLIDCNKSLADIVGYSVKELLSSNFENFTHLDDLEREWVKIREMWEGKRDRYHMIKRYIHKDGHIVWVDLVGSFIRDETGTPKLGFSFIQDITERVKAKKELKRAKEYYQGVINDQTELIVRWKDGDKAILTFVNKSYCDFFQKCKDDLIGKSFLELIPEVDRVLIEKNVAGITKENPIASHEHRVIRPDGTIGWTEWINRGIFNKKGELIEYQSVGRDITERKKVERRLRRTRKRSDFYKDLLAHDIRNILNNIKLSTQLLQFEESDSEIKEKKEEAMEIVQEQIERGKSLISNVKSFSILDNQEQAIKSVLLIDFLQKGIENIKKRFKQDNLEVFTDFSAREPRVKAGDMLSNAFGNLLLNAITHNESKTKKLWIKVSRTRLDGTHFVKIQFIDNGIGISDERKRVIFDRTYDKDNLTGGMGIGLSLVRRIIEIYGGQIKVENRVKDDVSKGSNFIVFLREA